MIYNGEFMLAKDHMFINKQERKELQKAIKGTQSLVNWQEWTNYYYDLLEALALSRFKVSNLPKVGNSQLTEYYLKYSLLDRGTFGFTELTEEKDGATGIIGLPATICGQLDIYGEPTAVTLIGKNGTNFIRNADNFVLVYNNQQRKGIRQHIHKFARALAEIKTSEMINVKGQKTPLLIECSEDERFSVKQAYQAMNGGEPVIATRKGAGINESLNVYHHPAPFVADKLAGVRESIIREYLTFLGIDNSDISKRERLIKDEVNANNESIVIMRENSLNEWRKGFEKVNERYRTNIQVSYNPRMFDIIEQAANVIIGNEEKSNE